MTDIQFHYYNLLPLDQLELKAFTIKIDITFTPVSLIGAGFFITIPNVTLSYYIY